MDARNRMASVVKLRCNVCQRFLRLLLDDGWQRKLYPIVKVKAEEGDHKEKYSDAYVKMTKIGVDQYTVEDMDVSFINQIINYCGSFVELQKSTKKAFNKLVGDRNFKDHSDENESDKELYLEGLLALTNLQQFVNTVFYSEINIKPSERAAFLRECSDEIEDLTNVLFDELTDTVAKNRQIERHIEEILNSADQSKKWMELYSFYSSNYFRKGKDKEIYYEFVVKASDAGITNAHCFAADVFVLKRIPHEAERRIEMALNAVDNSKPEVHSIISTINYYVQSGHKDSDWVARLIEQIEQMGYTIQRRENGTYCI